MSQVPQKPDGRTRHVAHHRSLHERVFGPEAMIKSTNTIKASRDSSGRYSLDVVPAGRPTAVITPAFPFKVYKPSNFSRFKVGKAFLGAAGASVDCNIDATKPTDLGADPPTVNPTTDAWRFWAVRCGLIELRPVYNLLSTDDLYSNFSWRYPVETNADGYSSQNDKAFDDPSTETIFPPLILGDPRSDVGILSFWVKIFPDTQNGVLPSAQIQCRNATLTVGPFPESSPNLIPLARIYTRFTGGEVIFVEQMTFNHVINRYPPLVGNYATGSWLNIRGTWDRGENIFDPEDLADQIFYPGDGVSVLRGVEGQNQPEIYQLAGNQARAWEDPVGNANWKLFYFSRYP